MTQHDDLVYVLNAGAGGNISGFRLSNDGELSPIPASTRGLGGVAVGPAQVGFNLNGLLNDATVAYVEWSGGRSRSLLSQALNSADDTSFRNRLATGMTYTTSDKLSLTLEYEYNGAGLDQAAWENLARTAPAPAMRVVASAERHHVSLLPHANGSCPRLFLQE